ncbi:MAG: N-acetyl sugar amidotransferase [Nitrospirota bacterium]
MNRCTRCILPDTYPDIVFDSEGVCHKCHEAERRYVHRDIDKLSRELLGIVNWAKSQKRRYDCIVPFSGGKDSTYTLYTCIEKFRLKTLAVNFNNGLRTEEALRNMDTITRNLGAAYLSYGPPWNILKKLYKEFLLNTGQFCFPCDMGIWKTVQRTAEQYDVPLIVSGFSAQIESRGSKIYSYNNRLFKTIAKNVMSTGELNDFLSEAAIAQKIARRLKRFRLTRYRRQISLPEYVVWDDKIIKDTLYRELNWQKRADGSSDHIDCLFAPMKNYLVVQKWGFGEKTTKYSAMVRASQMTREDALLQSTEEERRPIQDAMELFMQKLGVTNEDILHAKTKSHLGYL